MLKLKLLSVGKNKESWLEEAFDMYKQRLSTLVELESIWVKDDSQLISYLLKEPKGVICLDPLGKELDSIQFSKYLMGQFVEQHSRLCLVIGGPEGLPKEIRQKFPLISLSKLTMTHQIVRLILLEQIYRAFEIAKGSLYHK